MDWWAGRPVADRLSWIDGCLKGFKDVVLDVALIVY
jgi:hypothetical protein